jgi:hypothetical protein
MVLIIAPALDGLKKEWSEAAADPGRHRACSSGAMVGLPILWPSLLGTLSLLFANAFGAIATAYRADRLLAQHRAHPALSRRSAATCCTIPASAMRWRSA